MPPPTSRLGTTVAGRYRLEKLLGQGGMGEVYVAVQEPLGRRVALKLIRATLLEHASASSRFEREAKSLATLAHPNIVTLFDFGRTDDGEMFMAMELLPGESLRSRLTNGGRLPPRQALDLVKDVCRALEAAHRAGIVHRDLKPDNVMLADLSKGGGPKDVVKVLDFGIARLNVDDDDNGQPLTQAGHIVGTPGYIAPEMFTEGVLDDPRSDLYAVGVLTWELLTNDALFTAPTPVMLLMKHAQTAPPTLASTVVPGDAHPHPALDEFLAKLLHKNRNARFATAAAVVDAVDALPPEAFAPFGRNATVRKLAYGDDRAGPRSSLDPAAATMADTIAPGVLATPGPVAAAGAVDVSAPTVISQRRTPTPETVNTLIGPPPQVAISTESLPVRAPSSPAVRVAAVVVIVIVLAIVAAIAVGGPLPSLRSTLSRQSTGEGADAGVVSATPAAIAATPATMTTPATATTTTPATATTTTPAPTTPAPTTTPATATTTTPATTTPAPTTPATATPAPTTPAPTTAPTKKPVKRPATTTTKPATKPEQPHVPDLN